jgi:hypothetical protein
MSEACTLFSQVNPILLLIENAQDLTPNGQRTDGLVSIPVVPSFVEREEVGPTYRYGGGEIPRSTIIGTYYMYCRFVIFLFMSRRHSSPNSLLPNHFRHIRHIQHIRYIRHMPHGHFRHFRHIVPTSPTFLGYYFWPINFLAQCSETHCGS